MEQTLRNLIANGKTAQAIAELRQLTLSDGDLANQVILLSARFEDISRRTVIGLVEDTDTMTELQQINQSLLVIIDRLERIESKPKNNFITIFSNKRFVLIGSIFIGLIGILANLTTVLDYLGIKPNAEDSNGKPFSVVVYTHGNGGRQDILQLKETKLVADIGGRREVAKVGENGQNTFNEVSSSFRNKRIGIGLQGTEGYSLTHKDSTYLLNGEPIYLAVQSSCRFCVVEGFVQKQDAFIPNVVVSIDNFADTTDAKGYFKITIPPNKEQSEYATTVSMKGKIVKRLFITPNPKQPAEILIE